MTATDLVEVFRRARRDPRIAVLEGFHALKHAYRFDADIRTIVTRDAAALRTLIETLAPDLDGLLDTGVTELAPELFDRLAPVTPPTGVVALARRRETTAAAVLQAEGAAPVIALESPRHLGNVGAAIRVAAAAGAAGVIVAGTQDPWHPAAIRGAAGLQYALPVARCATLPPTDRLVIALDAEGEPLTPASIPPRAVLLFGTERSGLSGRARAGAATRLRIPMQPGISSLNLATAVAVTLYTWRLGR